MDKKEEIHIYLNDKIIESKKSDVSISKDKNDSIYSNTYNLTGNSSIKSEFNSTRRGYQFTEKKPSTFVRRLKPLNFAQLFSNLDKSDSEEEDLEEELFGLSTINDFQETENCSKGNVSIDRTEKENINPENNQNKNVSFQKKVEDSFELDFSALSLRTPKKKGEEKVLDTPEVIKPFSPTKPTAIVTKPEHDFATPQFKAPKIQFSAKKEMLHPQNSIKRCPSVPPTINEFSRPAPTVKTESNTNIITVKNVEYQVLSKIGTGGSSEVFHCFCRKTGKNYAIKCVSLNNPETTQGYINEVKILSKLQDCDKIIKMEDYEHLVEEKKLLVILEKGGEDLSTILKHLALRKSHISMHTLLFYWMEMLHAVKEIHSHGIIHSDLKPANFIQAGGGIKLIDFGIARCVQTDKTSVIKNNAEGSLNYISPESLKNESSTNINSPSYGKNIFKINYKSDVWSLGCILYQLVYRRTPFHHITQMWTKLYMIGNPNHQIEYPDAPWVSQKIIRTIKCCLQYDKSKRPTVEALIDEYEKCLVDF